MPGWKTTLGNHAAWGGLTSERITSEPDVCETSGNVERLRCCAETDLLPPSGRTAQPQPQGPLPHSLSAFNLSVSAVQISVPADVRLFCVLFNTEEWTTDVAAECLSFLPKVSCHHSHSGFPLTNVAWRKFKTSIPGILRAFCLSQNRAGRGHWKLQRRHSGLKCTTEQETRTLTQLCCGELNLRDWQFNVLCKFNFSYKTKHVCNKLRQKSSLFNLSPCQP